MGKVHYYCLVFFNCSQPGIANNYVALSDNVITKPVLDEAMNNIRTEQDQGEEAELILLSAVYLGFMTTGEFTGEDQ